jgi:DNA-binding NarL/FixJ family response regulator
MLELVAANLGNHETAHRLVLPEKTVRNHISAVLVKLQVPGHSGQGRPSAPPPGDRRLGMAQSSAASAAVAEVASSAGTHHTTS